MTEVTEYVEGGDATVSNPTELIGAIASGHTGVYSSIPVDSFEDRIRVFNALSEAAVLDDHVNVVFNLKDVVLQPVDVRQENGQMVQAVRTILITDKGEAFATVSTGIIMAIRNLFAIVGEPHTWPQPLAVKAVKEKGRNKFSFTTLKLASAPTK